MKKSTKKASKPAKKEVKTTKPAPAPKKAETVVIDTAKDAEIKKLKEALAEEKAKSAKLRKKLADLKSKQETPKVIEPVKRADPSVSPFGAAMPKINLPNTTKEFIGVKAVATTSSFLSKCKAVRY